MMSKVLSIVKVGIADLSIVHHHSKIRTSGLGSCVGIVIYDLAKQIAGMAHIMLPDSNLTKQRNFNKYKYADTAIDILVEKLLMEGARKFSLKAKIAGGAQMFTFQSSSEITRIGPRNVEAVEERLAMHRIPIVAKDVGGNSGRTIEFDAMTGMLKVRAVNAKEKFI